MYIGKTDQLNNDSSDWANFAFVFEYIYFHENIPVAKFVNINIPRKKYKYSI